MKKVIIITAIIVVLAMFAFPAIIFAEEGDVNSTIGVREQQGQAGQYILGDKDSSNEQPNDTKNDNTKAEIENGPGDGRGDGDTEVFCIDGETGWDTSKNAYVLTDIDVSEELEGEYSKFDDDDKDGIYYYKDKDKKDDDTVGNSLQTDGEIDCVEAEALEILSTNATGAGSVEDQETAWAETGDNNSSKGDADVKKKIKDSIEGLATDYILSEFYNRDDEGGLQDFLDAEDVNEIDVFVEQDSGIFLDESDPDYEPGTATAIMANPLVSGVTDEGKDVYWYILGGAFNISFSPDSLLMETSSAAPAGGSNAVDMTDKIDDNDGENSTDNDKDSEIAGDHYGIATVNYYYYYWGLEKYPQNTMGVNLFAWVDVDEDGLFDIVDIDPEKAADGMDSDGDTVGDFQKNLQVVQTEVDDKGTADAADDETVIKLDSEGNVETEPVPETDMDIHKIEGGKVVLAKKDLSKDQDGQYVTEPNDPERKVTKQRFSTISYNEPYDDDPIYYGTLIFKLNESGEGLPGAVFGIYSQPDAGGDPLEIVTTGSDGYASTAGLEWKGSGTTYYIKELAAPGGYAKNNTIYTIFLSGGNIYITDDSREENSLPFSILNNRIPPDESEEPDEPDNPDEPQNPGTEITVAGVTELPFTGMHPFIPISGISSMLGGLAMFFWSMTPGDIARRIRKYMRKAGK